MRRALVHTSAWAAATGAAVSLSWLGVSTVLREPAGAGSAAVVAAPSPSPTAPPPTTLPPTIGTATQRAQPSASAPRSASAPASPAGSASASPTATVKSYQIRGGQVAVSLGASSASLVSATPNAGWSMHVYTGTEWLRVDFEQGTSDSALFVTWNGHPPMVSFY